MNLFAIAGLSCGISCAILALIALIFGKTKIHRLLAFFNIAVSIWGFGGFIVGVASNSSASIFGWKFAHIGGMFVSVLFFHMICTFCMVQRKALLTFGYLQAIVFNFISWIPDKLITKTRYVYGLFYNDTTFLFSLAVLSYLILVIASFRELLNFYKISTGEKRTQTLYVIFGFLIGFMGGTSTFSPEFRIDIFYPIGNFGIVLYSLIVTYAILRHQLMDIEVIIKKTLVFASLFLIIFGIFVGITLLMQELIAGGRLLGLAISSVIIIFAVRPLDDFLIRITDRYLFQKKYDYKHLIRQFMDELKTMILNTTDVAQSTVDFLNTSIRPIVSGVFMYNKFTSQYDLIASSDFKDKALKIAGSSELVKILGDTRQILSTKNDDKSLPFQARERLMTLDIELMIPLLIHKDLIGFLCLGKKKSDENYSTDDIEALSDLSGALSISLSNAQLFDERADAEKRALVGTIATGINHEVGNPLNIITIKLETFRILAKEGLLANKSKEEIIDEVEKITKVCLDSAQRIAEITKQVSEFAKPDKKLIFGKVNISEAIDETIAFLKHGMILDSEKIEKRIICEPAYVFADRGQLKQILFNLIKNASHAIDKEKGKVIVSVDKNNGDEIAIKIIDNGHGMPKEVRDKVFTPFFTTKEPGRGTGLGLALVKIMIDRNNAKIKSESEEGKGTTFTLIFKGGLL